MPQGSRLSLPVGADVGHQLTELIRESEDSPVVAAVPILRSNAVEGVKAESYVLGEWDCATRVTRLVHALNASEKFIIIVHGLARIRLAKPLSLGEDALHSLPAHPIELVVEDSTPRRETINEFRAAALKLVDRLLQDTGKSSARREVLERFATMAEDLTDSRISWLADLMTHTTVSDYSDRLGNAFRLITYSYLMEFRISVNSLIRGAYQKGRTTHRKTYINLRSI